MLHEFDPSFASPSDWARFYRVCGLQAVPAHTHQEQPLNWKRPALAWRDLEHRTVDDLTFERWYGANGPHRTRSNMGFICGPCSGNVFVIDLDTHKTDAARNWWLGLLAAENNSVEFETPLQITGGGGVQMLFRAPPDVVIPTCKTGIGVDIRGHGGFAMLPPSMHESGMEYTWATGKAPWECEIEDAPQWLIDAVLALATEHGWRQAPGAVHTQAEAAYDAFGNVTDGREAYMTRVVWAAVLDLYRESPIKPGATESMERMRAAYEIYARSVRTRLPGDNEEGLEREGRGLSAFQDKWAAAMRQWENKVAVEAKNTIAINVPTPSPRPPARIELIPWDDLPEVTVKWLVKDFLPMGGFASIYGKPGSYKSFVALYLAACVGNGVDAFSRETTAGDVIYIAGEGGAGLKKRRDAFMRKYAVAPGTRVHFIRAQLDLRTSDADANATIEAIAAKEIKPSLVIIDTLARAFAGGNENASEDMGAFIRQTGRLQEALGGPTVLVVHHSGKDEARGMRGHSALLGAVDTELEVVKLSEEDSLDRTGQMTVTKQKDGEDGFKLTYRLELVPLSPITGEGSLVVVPDDSIQNPEPRKKRLTPNQQMVLEALRMAVNDEGEAVSNNNIPQGVKCARLALWRANFKAMSGLDDDARRKAFNRGITDLQERGTLGIWADHAWIVE